MDYQQKLPGAVFRMTGSDYANLVAAYVARRFGSRSPVPPAPAGTTRRTGRASAHREE